MPPPESVKRLLIVDDEKPLRFLFSMALEQEDSTVDEAANGREALNLLQEHEYDLVLLDLSMPGLSGLDVLKTMRARKDMTRVGIISAFIPGSAVLTAASLGVTSFLGKPMTLDFLRKAVDESLLLKSDNLLSRAHALASKLEFSKAFQILQRAQSELTPTASLWMNLYREFARQKSPAELTHWEPRLRKLILSES